MKNVLLDWHLGSTFGWGIVGTQLFLHWANDPEICALMGHPITPESLAACDPLRIGRAYRAIDASNRFVAGIRPDADGTRRVDATVVHALGNGFAGSATTGSANIGRCVFEDTRLSHARDALARYDALLVGSRWNAELLERATGRKARVIFEGVDTSLFCPGPRSGLMNPRAFHVFSGGKVEFRKAQDLVLLAFRRFHAMHREAVLVTAWQSIWPDRAVGFKGRLSSGVGMGAHGRLDIVKWAADNGVDPGAVIDVGLVPNPLMPPILREMDVALQPSRAEACTNLPVKEAMACGVPVIAAVNTGMRDLLDGDNAILLTRQTPVAHGEDAHEGWRESDVDEIVAALELAYVKREEARRRGLRARQWLIEHGRTWQAHASELKRWILSL